MHMEPIVKCRPQRCISEYVTQSNDHTEIKPHAYIFCTYLTQLQCNNHSNIFIYIPLFENSLRENHKKKKK